MVVTNAYKCVMKPALLGLLVGSSTKTHHIAVGVITVELY